MRMARWTFRLSLEEASGRPPLPGFPAGRDPLFNRLCGLHRLTAKEEFDKKEGGNPGISVSDEHGGGGLKRSYFDNDSVIY
jgi:hypothetical protein